MASARAAVGAGRSPNKGVTWKDPKETDVTDPVARLTAALADRYVIERELGAGGMATVYLARDLKHDRDVAVKVLRPDLGAVLGADRFLAEIKITARLDHPHILTLIDSGATEGLLYYVLPYVRGETLRGRLEREKQLGIEEAIAITKDIASALEYAHRQGVVHRDIKPENIMFQEGEAMLADFGIALAVKEAGGDRLTQTGLSLGTPQYMSPEQATGDRALDARSDVYSLAAVLYEMLTGDPPVTGATAQAMIAKLMTERPTRIRVVRDTVPEPVDTAVFKALAKIPADRFSGAREFADALDAGMRPATVAPLRGGRGRRIAAALAGLAVVGVVAALLLRNRDSSAVDTVVAHLDPGRQVSFVGDVGRFELAPDDRTVAYFTPDKQRVVAFDLDGGGSQTLYAAPSGTVLEDLQWSADGSRLYLTAFPYGNRLFSVPRLGGEPREELRLPQMISLSGVRVLALSAGVWLVVGANNTFYLGTDPSAVHVVGTKLTGDGTFAIPGLTKVLRMDVVASPDAKWLAFAGSGADGQTVGGIASLSPTEAPRVIAQWSGVLPVRWGRDGKSLTLRRKLSEGVADLLRVEFDPVAGRTLGDPRIVYPRLGAEDLAVNADGDRLVFVTGSDVFNLREFTLDGTPTAHDNPSRMVTQGTGQWTFGFFLPSGDVLGLLERDGGIEARQIAPDGSSVSVLQSSDTTLRWSKGVSTDGRQLASATRQNGVVTLLLQELASTRVRRIPLPQVPSMLAWSPDDRFIAAMTDQSVDELMVIDVAAGTTRVVKLQCGERCEFAWEHVAAGNQWPLVAVTSEVDTWIANVETGALRHLASNTWYLTAWIGEWVYFIRAGGQTDYPGQVLFRVPAGGGPEQRLLELPLDCSDGLGTTGVPTMSRDGSRVICPVDQSKRDLHVISGLGKVR